MIQQQELKGGHKRTGMDSFIVITQEKKNAQASPKQIHVKENSEVELLLLMGRDQTWRQ